MEQRIKADISWHGGHICHTDPESMTFPLPGRYVTAAMPVTGSLAMQPGHALVGQPCHELCGKHGINHVIQGTPY